MFRLLSYYIKHNAPLKSQYTQSITSTYNLFQQMSTSNQVGVGIGVLVFRNKNVLVGERKSKLGLGKIALPGGHLEFGESFEACALRELEEETGLVGRNPQQQWTVNTFFGDKHYITIFMKVDIAEDAVPQNLEPDKCAGWQWVKWPEGVDENCFQPLRNFIKNCEEDSVVAGRGLPKADE